MNISAFNIADSNIFGGGILAESTEVTASNSYIDSELVERIVKAEEAFGADLLTCIHPMMSPFDDLIREHMDDLQNKNENLLVLLETEGGSIETTERIVTVLRHHYKGEISFFIPNQAMSAGTILVMSGDRILMDYYSTLGPIDPQIRNKNNDWVPGLGYLEKYNEIIEKSAKGELTQAELAFLLDKFDPAHLHWLEQAREHGVDLLKEWLAKYKFKNWNITKDRQIPVTEEMRRERASEVAKMLNDTKKWRSHGRGLSIDIVRNELNLEVEDFGEDPKLADFRKKIIAYYRLLKDYMGRRDWSFVVQTRQNRFTY